MYILNHLPREELTLYFFAKNYQETMEYKISVEPQKVANLEVKLIAVRKIYFDLEIIKKPEFIMVLSHEKQDTLNKALKNKNNLYEYLIIDQKTTLLDVLVAKFVQQEVKIESGKEIYRLNLIEGFQGEIKVSNEEGQEIIGAEVDAYAGKLQFHCRTNEKGLGLLVGLNENLKLGTYHFVISIERLNLIN